MTIYNWPNGIGASLGETLGTCKPLSMSGAIYFVSNSTGNDSNDGGDEARPKATLAGAVSAATSNDIIVLLDGHTETLTSAATLSANGLTVVGTGTSGGKPTVKLKLNAASGSLIVASGASVALRNIWFQGNQQANSSVRISVSGAGFRMSDCYVECDQYDTGSALSYASGGDSSRIISTTFISIATSTSAQPARAIALTAAISDLELSGVILDAGAAGFSDYYAMNLSTAAVTRLRGESVTLKNGADVRLHASTVGYLNAQTVTGAGKVFW